MALEQSDGYGFILGVALPVAGFKNAQEQGAMVDLVLRKHWFDLLQNIISLLLLKKKRYLFVSCFRKERENFFSFLRIRMILRILRSPWNLFYFCHK